MNAQTVDIPILGIDKRLSERQSVPGLCKLIENLEPTGPAENPYWKRVKKVDALRNDNGVAFSESYSGTLIEGAWHTRSSVGKYADESNPSQSLKRLVTLHDNGVVRLIDPQSPSAWYEVASKNFGHQSGDQYSISFSHINDLLAFTVVKNGVSQGIYFVADDLIVEFEYPPLPLIYAYAEEHEEYTSEEFENGLFEGFYRGGCYVSFAYRLFDGTLIKQSTPRYIGFPRPGVTYKIVCLNAGFELIDGVENLDFWKDQIDGIAVLAGGYKAPFENGIPKPPETDDLKRVLFHEVGTIEKVDPDGQTREQRTTEIIIKGEDISTNPLAEITALSTKIKANVLDTFNSRMLLGGTSIDFLLPAPPVFNSFFDRVFYVSTLSTTLRINVVGPEVAEANIGAVSGLTNVEVTSTGTPDPALSRKNGFRADISGGSYSITLEFAYYSVTITQDDVTGPAEFVSFDNYSYKSNVVDVRVGVEIETEQGFFQRRSDWFPFYTGEPMGGSVYSVLTNGVFSYPDRRARKIVVWEKDEMIFDPNTNEYNHITRASADLVQSQTQNFSYLTGFWPADSTHVTFYPESVNQRMNYYSNRVQVSEVNAPFSFLAERTYYVGRSAGQEVIGFATNTLAVSEGQFGQYPVYVMCSDSIWALEQSQDPLVAFARISPVSLSHGAASTKQICNVGRFSAFVYQDGIFLIAGNEIEEISQAINNYPGSEELDFSTLVLASRQRAGDNELLISDGNTVYVYNLRYQRWYSINRQRIKWFTQAGFLYGIDSQGNIYDEQAFLQDRVHYAIQFDPIHFMGPELLKRLYKVYFRGKSRTHTLWVKADRQVFTTSQKELQVKNSSAYEFAVRITGAMDDDDQYIEALSAKIEGRYPHRNRAYVND